MVILLQCFDTIEQAYTYVDTEDVEDAIIFVHTGIYVGEFLLIDLNVSIIGAGMHNNEGQTEDQNSG